MIGSRNFGIVLAVGGQDPELFSDEGSFSRLVERYECRKIRRIRLARRTRFFLRRSLWVTEVRGRRAVKRTMDLAGALFLIVLLAPLLLLVALAIKLSDGGDVLYWQKRVGEKGTLFPFPKFRSMVPDADRKIVSVAGSITTATALPSK